MAARRPVKLDPPVDLARDHVLGNPGAEITLVEYGSYACPFCHAAHDVIAALRDRFGDRMRYVFRHLPIPESPYAVPAAELAEYAADTRGTFWEVHDALMKRGPDFAPGDLEEIASAFDLPPPGDGDGAALAAASSRVREDTESARRSGALVTPTFYINDRRYEGAWDESSLAEAMLGSLGHRLHTATLDFVRWGPSAGLLLLLMTLLAVVLTNSPVGAAFEAWWHEPFGFLFGGGGYTLPVVDWVNHGLLTVFFLVVGLEIKREFTVGRLATRRAAALPIAASLGGIVAPALLYLLVVPPGPLVHGWGATISTDTAFAVALIAMLGARVPVDLRVFLTAAVIVDDLVAIAVVAVAYSGALDMGYLAASVAVIGSMAALNRGGIHRPLPYAGLGLLLWICLHAAGLHATLAGVVLAAATPTRPPPNLRALLDQARTVVEASTSRGGDAVMRHGLSRPALEALDAIHDRIESPADKLLRSLEPWSSYAVLPVFALANAGVAWSSDIVEGHGRLTLAVILGLVLGKPLGILLGARLAVRLGVAEKPEAYTWRQLAGAGALGGIGFTMSLFIAGQAFASSADFTATKIAIFAASLIAGVLGTLILWRPVEIGSPAAEDTPAPRR
ncbi:MAG TPA: Na+/H+ antiporter NhaA [Thermodesulfobacteriota bacterium]